jgi:beta-phosphoglucomutase
VELQAVIFDMDGVITDTLEYHYLGWQRVCDEAGLPFDRETNERLRGLSRPDSLAVILDGVGMTITEEQAAAMLEHKQRYFTEALEHFTSEQILPGVCDLMQDIRAAGVKVAVGSASRNTELILGKLGILPLLDGLADSSMVELSKPAPDVFLHAAELVGAEPRLCAVIEDGEAGIEAALAAGMWAVGVGPAELMGRAHARFDSLAGVKLADLQAALDRVAEQP